MTREEYDRRIEICSVSDNDILREVIEKYYVFEMNSNSYIYSLEAHIAELEAPKSCDGCKYEFYDKTSDYCYDCIRVGSQDYYEPKEIK